MHWFESVAVDLSVHNEMGIAYYNRKIQNNFLDLIFKKGCQNKSLIVLVDKNISFRFQISWMILFQSNVEIKIKFQIYDLNLLSILYWKYQSFFLEIVLYNF